MTGLSRNLARGAMGRRAFLPHAGVILAFFVCAINLSTMARRTMVPAGASGDGGIPVSPSSGAVSDRGASSSAATASSTVGNDFSCFEARNDTVPRNMYGNLSLPFINLGFPKMGTSSIQSFFGCAGYRALHYRCGKTLCAECIAESARRGEPPLERCGARADVYSQVEGGPANGAGLYFPQVELLGEFVRGHPDATFLLPFRDAGRWYESVSNWPPPSGDAAYLSLRDRLTLANITGLPPGRGGTSRELSDFFCDHVRRVREMIPPRKLVEIDIEDPAAGSRMAEVFDLDEGCWGQANVNANLHPELNQSKGGVPWLIRRKAMLRGKNGTLRRRTDLPPLPLDLFSSTMSKIETVVGTRQAKNESDFMGERAANDIESILVKTSEKNINDMELVSTQVADLEDPGLERRTRPDSCQELIAHENGHWEHHTHSEDDEITQRMHYPEEMIWLTGRNLPQSFGKCTRTNKFLMDNSILGHQCGCGVRGYTPTRSVWVHDEMKNGAASEEPLRRHADYFARSPTLRLAKNLAKAGATLCFSGDSIDYQIYSAFHNNLRRLDQIQRLRFPGEEKLVSVVSREIFVKHATSPGNVSDWFLHGHRPPDGDGSFLNARRPPPGGFGSLHSILETKAFFRDEQSNGTMMKARIRYYMSYGWSPWNVDFMEDCNVVVMNLGLHYYPDGNHTGKETRHTLMDDMLAAITYLSNFTASKDNRIAVWRSALPQHFPTNDGHFYGWNKMRKDSCAVINGGSSGHQQVYNKIYDDAFSKLCRTGRQIDEMTKQSCNHRRHSCKVNPAAEVNYQTIYNFWRDNGCTEQIERELSRLSNLNGIEERHVIGTIFRWSIFDLFDVTRWHSKDMDCSHFCYIPPLFEAAFERLELLLLPLIASF